jgi:4-amino-4-deoxy-L-arabinose transferase-like glycosyltransferase
MTRRREQTTITLILLLAAVLRLWTLANVPPGLAHDEVANWLIARDILAGRHAIYFTAAYGHEPLYQYAQAVTVALFGDHWLGLRYPSVAFGLLGLAIIYVLVRRLFGAPVALLTGGWLATSFWPIFYARVALRAITLPFTAALAA